MKNLTAVLTLAVCLLAAQARADAIRLRNGKILGFKGETEVTDQNWKDLIAESSGEITKEGYAAIEMDKKSYPMDDVADYLFGDQPQALVDGFDQMGQGNFAQAISAFQEVLGAADAREVFKIQATYQIGLCYVGAGNLANAERHFAAWKYSESVYAPQVLELLARIRTQAKRFDDARKDYAAIGALPGIGKSWTYKARIGAGGVDIEERKFADAEAAGKTIEAEVKADPKLVDVLALAIELQSRAILLGDKSDRLPEARALLEQATGVKGLGSTGKAALYTALGDITYKQGDPDNARIAYLRVICLWPEQDAYVARALRNAGQCFIDLYRREEAKPEGQRNGDALKKYLVDGYNLLRECAAKFRGTPMAEESRRAMAEHRAKYEEFTK